MPQFAEMDEKVTLIARMEDQGGPVALINEFNVDPGEVDQLIQAWAADAAVMQRQPGYFSTQLHRGIGGSCEILNYAVWESARHFKQAFSNPEFQSKIALPVQRGGVAALVSQGRGAGRVRRLIGNF